jgi:hypothetical protein
MEVGFATICTVGAGFAVTVTVTVALAVVPLPVAVAVYVVVADGLTGCVPPVAPMVYVLPSEPLTLTCVAFVAVMVRMDEPPAVIDVGVAAIVTVGVVEPTDDTVIVEVAVADPARPVAVAV